MNAHARSAVPRATEVRLLELRDEATLTGTVAQRGVALAGGPIPGEPNAGYYGLPMVKRPVWTWEVGLYFFAGGAGGMSGVLALAALMTGQPVSLVRTALAVGVAGAVVSPMLLIADLGRPQRFLNMLRVFKWRSPMSMGAWTLVAFGPFVTLAFLLVVLMPSSTSSGPSQIALDLLVAGAALFGLVLATYTGVLLGATAIPAWSAHHRLLPVHFGIVGLGSAVAILELLGYRLTSLNAIGLAVAVAESAIGGLIEGRRKAVSARALHLGRPGLLLRTSGALTGPLSLVLRLAGSIPLAAASFLVGAILSRYGWIAAGRASAVDPSATIDSQRRG